MKNSLHLLAIVVCTFALSACGSKDALDDSDRETGQQIGDAMASIDESGSGGTIAMNSADEDKILRDSRPLFARYGVPLDRSRFSLLPDAQAASCLLTSSYTSPTCSSNTLVRTFGGCTVGLATFAGTVTLVWGGSATNCLMTAAGATITRTPSFTVTGLSGATLAVSQTGSVGQRLLWSSGTYPNMVFLYSNDGIRRVFTLASTPILDFTTSTTSYIAVSGNSRSNRVVTSGGFHGSIQVTNNLTGGTCTFTPSNVTWTSTCNCATSGSWTGNCSNGTTSTLTITGCGTADLEINNHEGVVNFDRCYGT